MTTTNAPNTTEMFKALSPAAQDLVPQLFFDQARAGYQKFFVGHTELLNRDCQLILQNPSKNIDPETQEEYVTAKIQLNAFLEKGVNEEGQMTLSMIPLKPQAPNTPKNTDPNKFWIKGFYSPILRFDRALVEGGFITADEQKFLFDYVSLWETNGDDNYKAGSDAAKQRIYLRSKNANSFFEFGLEDRTSTKTNEPVPGMTSIGWTQQGFELFGTGIKGQAVRIEAAVASHKTPGTNADISRPVVTVASAAPTLTKVGGRSL